MTSSTSPLRSSKPAFGTGVGLCLVATLAFLATVAGAEDKYLAPTPLAIVPIETRTPEAAPRVSGALEVTRGRAVIVAGGSISAGNVTTPIALPRRGTLHLCATTTVKLATAANPPAGQLPGLLLAFEKGALELSLAPGSTVARAADLILTPDFRLHLDGTGAAELRLRLGEHGDTCVDNASPRGLDAVVTSLFGGSYRVGSGQRVMFQHGNLGEVVDSEKEPCGCPPSEFHGNEFPLAQSEGLAPLPPPPTTRATAADQPKPPVAPLVYLSADHAPQPVAVPAPEPPAPAKKKGSALARFFHRLFGG